MAGTDDKAISILDIAPLTEEVTIRGKKFPVWGITAEALLFLITNFPEIMAMFSGRAESLQAGDVLAASPHVVAAVISVGLLERETYATSQDWLKDIKKMMPKARSFSVSEQLNCVTKILALTFTEGTGPFVEQINALGATFNGASVALGKGSVTQLQPQFSAALQTGMAPPPGDIPPENSTGG